MNTSRRRATCGYRTAAASKGSRVMVNTALAFRLGRKRLRGGVVVLDVARMARRGLTGRRTAEDLPGRDWADGTLLGGRSVVPSPKEATTPARECRRGATVGRRVQGLHLLMDVPILSRLCSAMRFSEGWRLDHDRCSVSRDFGRSWTPMLHIAELSETGSNIALSGRFAC